jgi:hypothetical protein
MSILSPCRKLWSELIEETSELERFIAFGLIPLILLSVGSIPRSIQISWFLKIENPTILDMYMSNFVHLGVHHLSNNILSTEMVLVLLVTLAVYSNRKRELFWISVLLHLLVPFAISVYSIQGLAATEAKAISGYSGISAAYVGLLTVFTGYLIKDKVTEEVSSYTVAGILMGLLIGAIFYILGSRSSLVIILLTVPTLLTTYLLWSLRGKDISVDEPVLLLLLVTIPTTVVISFNLILFADGGTNVYGHLIGLVSGFFIAIVPAQAKTVFDSAKLGLG